MKFAVEQLHSEENVPLHSIQDNLADDSTQYKINGLSYSWKKPLLTNH